MMTDVKNLTEQDGQLSPLKRALVAIKDLRARVDSLEHARTEPIAIVGMACRYPGAPNVQEFWRMLESGTDAIRDVPPDRWDVDAYYDPDPDAPGKMYVRQGGFIDQVDKFDAGFFGISPREVVTMDPQQRLLLEVSWEALENAGITAPSLSTAPVGVFVGISTNDYNSLTTQHVDQAKVDAYMGTGGAMCVAAGRISYILGVRGPAMAIDTACSSSLVAVDLAVQHLRTGKCSLALAGGVNLVLAPTGTLYLSKFRALSPTDRCRSFDASADGYVRGEGCGVLVLKRLSQAQADGDNILAVIRGSATNHDGRSSGLTVPSGLAQQAVIRAALENGNVDPAHVDYVEAHGTGTPLGDPIELRALGAVLREGRAPENRLRVGTVKTNIGHSEAASGVAAVIKVVLSMQHKRIPPTLHFTTPNPHIPWDELPLDIVTRTTPWEENGHRQIGGVSSYGLSGTNVHLVLEATPSGTTSESCDRDRPLHPLTLSAASDAALKQLAGNVARHLEQHAEDAFADVVFSANTGRAALDHRLAVVAGTQAEAIEALRGFEAGATSGSLSSGRAVAAERRKVAFLFTGQGSQYAGMARELYETEPVFRATLDRCDALLSDVLPTRLLSVLSAVPGSPEEALIDQTGYTQPALYSVECALADLWRAWGITPAAVMGHSVGEYAAAYVAGVFSLEDGLRLIAARGRLMQALPAGGRMTAVFATEAVVARAVAVQAAEVSIAAINGPENTVISGSGRGVAAVLSQLAAEGIRSKDLVVSHAFHSPLMDAMLAEYERIVAATTFSDPSIRLISNVTGKAAGRGEVTNAAYWRRHVREAVRFADSVRTLHELGIETFLEIGPNPVLLGMASRCVAEATGTWLPSLRKGQSDWSQMLRSLASLYVRGADVDWKAFDAGRPRRRLLLPNYPFQRERYWIDTAKSQRKEVANRLHPLLETRLQSPLLTDSVFTVRMSANDPDFVADHVVFDLTVFPATGYIEIARAAARLLGHDSAVEELAIDEPLILDADVERDVQVVLASAQNGRSAFRVFSRAADARSDEPWSRHASGFTRPFADAPAVPDVSLDAARASCADPVDVPALYETLKEHGINYGPLFRGMQQLWKGERQALGRLQMPARLVREKGYLLHPAFLDAALQVMGAAFVAPEDSSDQVFLPVGIQSVRVYAPVSTSVWSWARIHEAPASAQTMQVDVRWFDDDGRVLLELNGITVKRASAAALRKLGTRSLEDWVYEIQWEAREIAGNATAPTRWLVLGERGAMATHIADALRKRGAATVHGFSASQYIARPDEYELNLEDPAQLEEMIADAGAPLDGIVCLADVDRDGSNANLDEQELAVERSSRRVFALVKALTRAGQAPRLFLITRGAQAAGSVPNPLDLAQAALWGLGRVVALEHPELRCTLVDLDPFEDTEAPAALADELCGQTREDQVALRGGVRLVPRLVRHRRGASDKKLAVPDAPSFQLTTTSRGVLDTLVIEPRQRRRPAAGEVEIEVIASGLNFRDVLNALGMYPGDPGAMGGECAGRITAVGEGVTHFQIGDEVVGLAGGSFSRFVVTPAKAVVHKPSALTFEQMATVPVTFLTAHYGLHALAGIKRGDRVLIHAAAGGVGMAALQLALRAGAEVYGTAGSAEKRAFVRSLGARAVFSSRQADFADEMRALTGGYGVDIVLNALTGDFIPQSLAVLAPGGRFLEIGKAEIWDTARVAAINPDVTYRPFDLAEVMLRDIDHIEEMFRDVMAGIEDGSLRPLPFRVFSLDDAVTAYRFMAQAKHVGKIVLSLRHLAKSRGAAESPLIYGDGSYLITGGCGGLGVRFAEWLVSRGARHLVLTGRSEPGAGATEAIAAMREAGVTVDVVRADISSAADVQRVLDTCDASGHMLRGVIHAAGVLDDGVVLEQTWERTATVLAPKMRGAWLLHERTASRPLDFFALFSSVSSALGSPGQSNYAAANAYLDGLAHHRRALGSTALTLNWGGWSEVGMAARLASRDHARMSDKGVDLIAPAQGVAVFEQLLKEGATQSVVVPIRWSRLLEGYRRGAEPPMLETMAVEGRRTGGTDTTQNTEAWQGILAAAHADRPRLVERLVAGEVAHVVGLGGSNTLDPDTELSSLGVDSLMAVELKNRLETSTGLPVSIAELLEAGSVRDLAATILGLLGAKTGENAGAPLVAAAVGAAEEGEL